MKADGSIIIEAGLNNSGLEKDFKKTKTVLEKNGKSAKKLGENFENAGKKGKQAARETKEDFEDLKKSLSDLSTTIGLSFGLDQLLEFGRAAIDVSSDLQEVQNVVDTSFGEMSGQVEKFAQNSIQQFGMSELAAKQTAGRYMAMTTAMGITGKAAAEMSLNITGLTGDLASFYNVSQEVASTALASIWTGETESLKQFGIVMTQTNLEAFALSQGINRNWQELTQAEQVQLRYNYVLEQTRLAQGDFAKTQDSWANQNRILSETFTKLSGDIGEGIMDALTPLLGVVNDIVTALSDFQEKTGLLDDFFGLLIGSITGLIAVKAASVIRDVAAALVSLSGAELMANMQTGIVAMSLGALVITLGKLAGAWNDMNGAEKAVAVLGTLTAAATVAAVAMGAFHSAATMGVAAVAIVAGIVATTAAVNNATRRAKSDMAALQATFGDRIPEGAQVHRRMVPKLATGAVIPPNGEFLAILGDQKQGRNLEAPEGLLRQIVREESSREGIGGVLTIRPAPGLTRYLSYELEAEHTRAGRPLVEGSRR